MICLAPPSSALKNNGLNSRDEEGDAFSRTTIFAISALFAFSSLTTLADCDNSSQSAYQLSQTIRDFDSVTKNLLAQNISSFCEESLRQDYVKGNAYAFSVENILKLADVLDPWSLSMYPDKAVRMATFLKHGELRWYGLNSLEKAESYLENPHPLSLRKNESDSVLPPKVLTGPGFPIEDLENEPGLHDEEIKKLSSPVITHLACGQVTSDPGCPQALLRAVQLAQPKSGPDGTDVSYVSLYRDVLFDRTYDSGLRIAALKVLHRVKLNDISGTPNLFDDLKSSFKQAGQSDTQAEEMTWKTLGLIATGGPNIAVRIFGIKTGPQAESEKVALSVISSLAPVLDLMTFKSGHPYSYPSSIKTTCETGKSYHFWLSAYLARDLVKQGFSPLAASTAAFTADKGYQILSSTAGRYPVDVLTDKPFDPSTNTIRMDLAFSSAGSIFGAFQKQRGMSLDVDQGLAEIIKGNGYTPRLNLTLAQAVANHLSIYGLWWSRLVAPDAAFSLFLKRNEAGQ